MSDAHDPRDEPLPAGPPSAPDESPPASPPGDPPLRGPLAVVLTVASWLVIAGFVALSLAAREMAEQARAEEPEGDRIGLVLMQGQARHLVGARAFIGPAKVYEQAAVLNTGPVPQRLAFVALAGELAGPVEALARLAELDQAAARAGVQFTPAQARLRDTLGRLYRDYARLRLDAPSVTAAEQGELRAALGWFGELALTPAAPADGLLERALGGPGALIVGPVGGADPAARAATLDPAARTFWTLVSVGGAACLFGFTGLVGLIVFVVFVARGHVRSGIDVSASRGSIYAETFAVWILLFTGLSLLGLLLPREGRLPLSGAAALLSLAALAWPVVRGVPWSTVREDIGLTGGSGGGEVFWGAALYCMTLPLLALALVASYLLLAAQRGDAPAQDSFAPNTGPAHPIVADVAAGDPMTLLLVFVLACVVAPIVEETMFRGVLYRHLRELSRGLGTALSFLLGAVVVSLVFAAIHPQGPVGVPVLAALAFGFTVAREWRGTLVPAMVAHGLSNGVVLAVTYLAFAG